ncbi:MAG: SusC/RagA family TonB-linked outer membrane protein [Cyclobacteriaceae bacterium]|nr:SusC/RagA family TonB-linked outer membrane protein [Cyclobacteriaceae bacterium]
MRKILLLIFCCSFLAVNAQQRIVSGKVTSAEDGSALPGVSVLLKGTSVGTSTDADGKYSLSVPASGGSLVFSFIGSKTQEVVIGERSLIDVSLMQDVTQLSEVIVTAQGIERDNRSLGYALQTVKGSDVAQRSETNLLNTLQGKLSGVNITGASGGAGASTNINIRGITSFSGSNQPLIVVDGIIFNNAVNQTLNTLFGNQPTNRLNDISPENIESLTVLKGPAASVLYGSRAASGVIVITTKKGGTASGKTEVTLTSSVNFQDVYGLAKLQNRYGQGLNNDFNNTATNSWGPAFGGSLTEVTTIQGETVPYKAFPNNVEGFFNRGRIVQNGINIASGDKDKNAGLSISSTFQDGIIPNTGYTRNSIQLSGNNKLNNGLKIGSSISYVRSTQDGMPQGNGASALGQITRIPRSYDLLGRPYKDANGKSIFYNLTQNHPLWNTEYETLKSTVDRIFGHVTLGYDIKPWLNVSYRATGDVYTDRRKSVRSIGAARAPLGQITEDIFYAAEYNGDLMITASKNNLFLNGLNASLLVGQNINERSTQNTYTDAQELTILGFDNVSNGTVYTGSGDNKSLRRLVGFYSSLNLSYNNYLFLELQGRIDKSSTLPAGNNSFFYPGVSVSFVPTDAFDFQSKILSYAKIRGSIAKVGKDANVYLLKSFYETSTQGNNLASITFPMNIGGDNIPGFQAASRIGSNTLTPEFTTTYEGGVNVGLFKNKLSVDVGYFYTESSNQIFNVAISNSSGFDTRTTNVGMITNKGWEVELSATPIRTSDFSWDISFNWTRLRNKVVDIAEGITSSTIIGNTFGGLSPSIARGYPYGVIIATGYAKNANGDRLVNPNTGLYMPGVANTVIANPNPEWISGFTNTFTYKGISLAALVDVKYGHDLYSFGWIDLRSNGSLEITAKDREMPRVLPGVIDNGDGTFTDNYIQVSAQSYWQGLGGLATEAGVFNATTYRLRELSLSYSLPASVLSKTPFGSVNIGVSGRNLWFYSPHAPGDPELNTQGAGNIQGMDLNGAPNTRNYGFNLRITL